MEHKVEELISADDIQARVKELGEEISTYYAGSEHLILVGLLRGSVIFMADLARAIDQPVTLDFMTVSSYGSAMSSSRDVKVLKDLDEDIEGADILLIEDIVDSGHTLSKVLAMLALRNPRSMKICTLLDKPSGREVDVNAKWVGFEVPDTFVVGYGIDYSQRYRNLPYLGKVVPV
ncbi:hypoxanthine phosphoribosyltransferase [Neiella marina]|uniref:Hypoxanthine phosphoribosyltransferase n=1 Tax=Neiella holothuriorum TaxID=2870530 RepID=A0ABS7EFV1_9GAMM|nr:hypoxanthine phosphoribosyltransferase [Neiella holothuriorum]MBW8191090.1 hypoxanthine phosphoribosyltransferase [Neiella holothuriorum]